MQCTVLAGKMVLYGRAWLWGNGNSVDASMVTISAAPIVAI
jgi:hypothetical protein